MKNKTLYDMKYIRENYHRIDLKVPFDDYEKWKAAAEAEGLPVATWIKSKCNDAIDFSEEREEAIGKVNETLDRAIVVLESLVNGTDETDNKEKE